MAPSHSLAEASLGEMLIDEINRSRASGAVKRCHTFPTIGEYTVGQHSYDALGLLLLLHPDASGNLIRAVLWHDAGERRLGDLPATAKWRHEGLGQVYGEAEMEVLREEHPTAFRALVALTREEYGWLRTVDALELVMWCDDQLWLGNQHARVVRERVTTRMASFTWPSDDARAFYEHLCNRVSYSQEHWRNK